MSSSAGLKDAQEASQSRVVPYGWPKVESSAEHAERVSLIGKLKPSFANYWLRRAFQKWESVILSPNGVAEAQDFLERYQGVIDAIYEKNSPNRDQVIEKLVADKEAIEAILDVYGAKGLILLTALD